jgi:hypothetical protein
MKNLMEQIHCFESLSDILLNADHLKLDYQTLIQDIIDNLQNSQKDNEKMKDRIEELKKIKSMV